MGNFPISPTTKESQTEGISLAEMFISVCLSLFLSLPEEESDKKEWAGGPCLKGSSRF